MPPFSAYQNASHGQIELAARSTRAARRLNLTPPRPLPAYLQRRRLAAEMASGVDRLPCALGLVGLRVVQIAMQAPPHQCPLGRINPSLLLSQVALFALNIPLDTIFQDIPDILFRHTCERPQVAQHLQIIDSFASDEVVVRPTGYVNKLALYEI